MELVDEWMTRYYSVNRRMQGVERISRVKSLPNIQFSLSLFGKSFMHACGRRSEAESKLLAKCIVGVLVPPSPFHHLRRVQLSFCFIEGNHIFTLSLFS